jgi:hypothetical protein
MGFSGLITQHRPYLNIVRDATKHRMRKNTMKINFRVSFSIRSVESVVTFFTQEGMNQFVAALATATSVEKITASYDVLPDTLSLEQT